jgi:hypothetical protein
MKRESLVRISSFSLLEKKLLCYVFSGLSLSLCVHMCIIDDILLFPFAIIQCRLVVFIDYLIKMFSSVY